MHMKASEVGDRLRQIAGICDHRKVAPDDDLVLWPGLNFDRLMGNPAAGQPPPSVPEQGTAGHDRSEIDDHDRRGRTARSPA